MPTTRTFKDVLDEQLKEKLAQSKVIQVQMPMFFRMKHYNSEGSKAFTPLAKDAKPIEWHETIKWIQLCLKDTRADASEMMEACRELLRFSMEAFKVLSEAYEVQGLVLIKVCEQLGVDFDSLLADFVIAKNEKGVNFIVQSTETMEVSSSDKGTKKEEVDSSVSMPF